MVLDVEAHIEAAEADEEIHDHRAAESLQRPDFLRQPAEEDGEGNGHDLGHKQGQDHADIVQLQLGAVGGGHGDDGAHPVDIEEIGHHKQENMLLGEDIPWRCGPDSEGWSAAGSFGPLYSGPAGRSSGRGC